MGGHHEKEREHARQRRVSTDAIGFNRKPLIPEGESGYEAPEHFPEAAKRYLMCLARIGTLSGACKLAGAAPKRVYEWRAQLKGFEDEEDAAKDAITDYLEENLFDASITEVGMARVKALTEALKANRGTKYNPRQEHQIQGSMSMTWIDILSKTEGGEDEE